MQDNRAPQIFNQLFTKLMSSSHFANPADLECFAFEVAAITRETLLIIDGIESSESIAGKRKAKIAWRALPKDE